MALTEVITANPKTSLAVISFFVTLFSTVVHKWMTNQEHMKNLKARQKELQKELKNCKEGDKMKELQSEMLKLTGVMFKSSFRPLFITLIPLLILFAWLRGTYSEILSGWLWWYIGFSIAFSMVIRKILDVH